MSSRKMFSVVLAASAGAAVIGLSSRVSSAALEAFDNAANYTSSWSASTAPTTNNGQNFGAWYDVLSNSGSEGTFYAHDTTSADTTAIATNGPGAPPGLSSGTYNAYSWGVYANTTSAARIDIYRPFSVNPSGYQDPSGLGTLVNQTFSIDLSSEGIGNAGAYFGFSLQTGQTKSATNDITIEDAGGVPNGLSIIDNDGTSFDPGSTNGNGVYTNPSIAGTHPGTWNNGVASFADLQGGLIVTVSVGGNPDGLNPYTITVTNDPNTVTYLTYSNYENGPIQQVDVFDMATTNDNFFNSLVVAPEPGSLGMLALGAVGLMLRRRKTA